MQESSLTLKFKTSNYSFIARRILLKLVRNVANDTSFGIGYSSAVCAQFQKMACF